MASKVIRSLTRKLSFGGIPKQSSSVSSDASKVSSRSSSVTASEWFPKVRRAAFEGPAQIPVFMLPRKHSLSRIPEDQEIRQGFSVIVDLKPDSIRSERSFAGLMSISDLDDQPDLIEETAGRGVRYKCFSWFKKC